MFLLCEVFILCYLGCVCCRHSFDLQDQTQIPLKDSEPLLCEGRCWSGIRPTGVHSNNQLSQNSQTPFLRTNFILRVELFRWRNLSFHFSLASQIKAFANPTCLELWFVFTPKLSELSSARTSFGSLLCRRLRLFEFHLILTSSLWWFVSCSHERGFVATFVDSGGGKPLVNSDPVEAKASRLCRRMAVLTRGVQAQS